MARKYHNSTTADSERAIPGFPRYFATDSGDIVSIARGERRTLAGSVDKDGYRKVILCERGIRHYKRVHVLVALAFRGEQPAGTVVCHLDGDHTNNAASNLAYVTQRENIAHKNLHGTMKRGVDHCQAKLSEESVHAILADSRPARVIAREHGVSKGAVDGIRSGRNWRHLSGGAAHG